MTARCSWRRSNFKLPKELVRVPRLSHKRLRAEFFSVPRFFFSVRKKKNYRTSIFFQDLISSSLEKLLNQVFRDSRFADVGDRQFPAEARQSETDMKVSPFVSTTTTTTPTTTTTTPVATTTTSSESAVTRSRPSFCHLYPKA